ncbi:tetratricopeptide repeat protein [Nevskia sp.]|uniref:protein kinase domain-containing protein n=1 Tax=Nevskia sp. TaxID=1929292 RepID=UPI0025FD8EA5|nr:tetratricopeptide repeat protein [Nevskia sp.]
MSRKALSEVDDGDAGPVLLGARWQFGAFDLNEKRLELRRDGELLKIESKPLNLLMAFLRQPDELITKNDLISALWPNGIATDAMLGNCVARLRTALGDDGPALIKTVFGFGYRFDAKPKLQLDQTAVAAPPKLDFKTGDTPPMRPNWRLVRRLGLSGDSWLVEHIKSRARRVFKFSNEEHGLSALKREVTIYRLLRESLGDKVCYVDLLDWNFDEAPWFIEAEYCPSGSLQEWFAAQGGVDKVPFATRLDLIIQIAEALAAVHAVGVLHKDLKPANVFVVITDDGRPTIRLADFGSSGLHDTAFLQRLEITRAGFTQMLSGAHSGTLLYLAPEVSAGQPATVRADIYALGLMLYQFATGNLSRQLATGWEAEIDDEILREDIAASTDGNPDRRLADAAELARRLRTIETRRIALNAERAAREKAERVARQLERIKARRVGLLVAFAALAIGFVTSAWLYVDARKARDLAQQQALRAETEQKRAEKVANFLGNDMFAAAATEDVPVRDLTVRQLLDGATKAASQRFADEPTIAAAVYESLGRSYLALEYIEPAARALESAMKLRIDQQGIGSKAVLEIAEDLVGLTWPLGELPKKLSWFNEIQASGEQAYGEVDPAVVRLKVAIARGKVQLGLWTEGQQALIVALNRISGNIRYTENYINSVKQGLAFVSMDLQDFLRAEELLREVIDSATRLRGADHADLATARMRLGHVYGETGRFDLARKEFLESRRIAALWSRDDGSTLLTIRLYEAWLAIREGRLREAIKELHIIKLEVAASDSGVFDQSYTESEALAVAYAGLGEFRDAKIWIEKALQSAYKTLSSDSALNGQHPKIKSLQYLKEKIHRSSK